MAYQKYTPQIPRTPEQAKASQATGRKGALGCGIALLVVAFVLGLPFIVGGAGKAMFLFVPFLGVGAIMVVWGLIPLLRAVKVEEPSITFSESTLRVGEGFDVAFQQRFKSALTMDFAKMTLIMRETARYQRGTNTYTDTHEIVVDTTEMPGCVYQRGETLELSHHFAIPLQAMHTFLAVSNRIEWIVRIHVSLAKWPDFKEEYPVTVTAQRFGPVRAEDR